MQRTNDVSACMNSYGSTRFSFVLFVCLLIHMYVKLFLFSMEIIILKKEYALFSFVIWISSEGESLSLSLSLLLSLVRVNEIKHSYSHLHSQPHAHEDITRHFSPWIQDECIYWLEWKSILWIYLLRLYLSTQIARALCFAWIFRFFLLRIVDIVSLLCSALQLCVVPCCYIFGRLEYGNKTKFKRKNRKFMCSKR